VFVARGDDKHETAQRAQNSGIVARECSDERRQRALRKVWQRYSDIDEATTANDVAVRAWDVDGVTWLGHAA
jgi:hypothetical protein